MDTSSSLATESFSRSWLNNTRFSLDDQDDPLRTSLYLYDDDDDDISWKIRSSKRFIEPQSPNFNFHSSEFSPSLIHADEIFSNGKILPIYRDGSIREDNRALPTTSPISSSALIQLDSNHHSVDLLKSRKSSKNIIVKYLKFLKPLCSKLGCIREGVKVDDVNRKLWEMNSLDSSSQASPPQRRNVFAGDHWFDIMVEKENESDDFERNLRKSKSWSHFSPQLNSPEEWSIESSIYEAILHCKKSYEK